MTNKERVTTLGVSLPPLPQHLFWVLTENEVQVHKWGSWQTSHRYMSAGPLREVRTVNRSRSLLERFWEFTREKTYTEYEIRYTKLVESWTAGKLGGTQEEITASNAEYYLQLAADKYTELLRSKELRDRPLYPDTSSF